VTAAVLVNDRMTGSGKQTAWKPRDPEEMKRLTMLAEAAIGLDQGRGDQISVENISFQDNGAPEVSLPERLLRGVGQSEALLRYGTVLAAMLGLILFVVRPIAARALPAMAAALPPGAAAAETAAQRPEGALAGETDGQRLVIEEQRRRAQSLHDGVVESIKDDPALSARLLQSWIHAE
jgi:flagellar M-ring protein FliF